jgi:ribosomal protein L24
MTMQTGDKVTIKRGKLNGQEGEVKLANAQEVFLELADGSFTTQKIGNIKTPTEATITQDELAAILSSAVTTGGDTLAVRDVIHALDAK